MSDSDAQQTESDLSFEERGTDQPLRRDVRMLGYELGRVLKDHGSPGLFELVEQIRALSKQRRAGDRDAGTRMREKIASLSLEQLRELIHALACFFDLANLAEDRHRIRVLRERERQRHPAPRSESIGAALDAMAERGVEPERVQALLDELNIELVFTAHPTEAKRRTIREAIRRLREGLIELEHPDLLPRERDWLLQQIMATLDCLWETDSLRPRRPTVLEEVHRSLFVAESLWRVVPWLHRSLRQGLARAYPEHRFREPAVFVRFGSWVGGDRDGNPYVTSEVTRETLTMLRQAALDKHLEQCDQLLRVLSISDEQHPVSRQMEDAIADARLRWPDLEPRMQRLHPRERYRHWLNVIRYRLEQTRTTDPYQGLPDAAYTGPADLAFDLSLVDTSLRSNEHSNLAEGELRDWLDRVAVFGFHLARLDVREDSRRLRSTVGELMAQMGLCDDYAALDEPDKQALLAEPIDPLAADRLKLDRLSDEARETAQLFQLLESAVRVFGIQALGTLIVSMTHQPSDALTMLWLGRLGAQLAGHDEPEALLPIVPLFETIEDLQHASDTLESLLDCAAYADHVEQTGGLQVCMIGYSDSTKDGGYLAANWQQYEGQRRLADLAAKRGVKVMNFHGRGGALGRGGGPAARGIMSLPPASVDGRLRMTEQGEVIAERYDDPEIAYRHLEQVTWATMLVSTLGKDETAPAWAERMQQASEASEARYRELIRDEGFLHYFNRGTPIDVIETLPIASRPSRRRGERQLKDLRAIPYTFAWTQNRHLVTAWFGMGAGLEAAAGGDWAVLREMYERWPFFQAVIDNAELALAKTDLSIGQAYSLLVNEGGQGQRVWEMIRGEFERSRDAVLRITQRDGLLAGTPWLERSIRVRNPYVDPLNFIQVELMRRMYEAQQRDAPDDQLQQLNEALRLSVQGIAAGMRTTG